MKIEVDMDFITENDLFHVVHADQKCQVPEMQNLGMVLMTENYIFECTEDMHKEGVYVLKWYYDIYMKSICSTLKSEKSSFHLRGIFQWRLT